MLKVENQPKIKRKMVEIFAETDMTNKPIISNMFEGFEFYIVNSKDPTKSELEHMIFQHGGKRV